MLYGIIADIHSNLEALEVVLNALKPCDKLICVGDIVGYGPNPNECIELMIRNQVLCVAGNHDKAAVYRHSTQYFNENAKLAIQWTQSVLTDKSKEFLIELPLIAHQAEMQIVHGSLRSPLDEYIDSVAKALPTFSWMRSRLCFVGHTHKPIFFGRTHDGNFEGRDLNDEDEILVDDYEKIIINPGSVGQPRVGNKRASFGIYNDKTKIFSLHKEAYPILKTQKKMQEENLPQQLIDRLSASSNKI